MHPGCEPDAENQDEDEVSQDAVADVLVVDDIVDVQVDVGDVSEELLDEDVHDVDLDDFPRVVGDYQSHANVALWTKTMRL